MSPTFGRGKSGKPHRYYASQTVLTGKQANAPPLSRIPAPAIEELVEHRVGKLLAPAPFTWVAARQIIRRITLSAEFVRIGLSASDEPALERLRPLLPEGDELRSGANGCVLQIPIRLRRRAGAARLLDPKGRRAVDRPEPDSTLLRALGRARRWRSLLLSGAHPTAAALARAEGVSESVVYHVLPLAYLAPDLVRDILDGRQRPGLTLDHLSRSKFPLDWTAQRRMFGVVPHQT